MKPNKLNNQTERMGRIYDFVQKAIATWDEEKKESILLHMVCLWVVAADAEDKGGIRHPLVQHIRNMLRSHGLKTAREIVEPKKKLED